MSSRRGPTSDDKSYLGSILRNRWEQNDTARPRARLGIVTEGLNKPAPTEVPGLAVCGRTTKRYRLSPFIIHLDKSLRRLFVDYENDITLFFFYFVSVSTRST